MAANYDQITEPAPAALGDTWTERDPSGSGEIINQWVRALPSNPNAVPAWIEQDFRIATIEFTDLTPVAPVIEYESLASSKIYHDNTKIMGAITGVANAQNFWIATVDAVTSPNNTIKTVGLAYFQAPGLLSFDSDPLQKNILISNPALYALRLQIFFGGSPGSITGNIVTQYRLVR